MKLLGRGWQYSTYDLGNGRVRKIYNSRFVAYPIILRDCFPYIHHPIWKIPAYYRGCRETAVDSMEKIRTKKLPPWMFGNPRILDNLAYEQDKVVPLHELLQENSKKAEEIIDSFVAFTLLLIQSGVIDKSFNIAKNFGMDASGRIVLMDLGEIYSSQAAIQKQIKERVWSLPYVTSSMSRPLRAYFLGKMDDALLNVGILEP